MLQEGGPETVREWSHRQNQSLWDGEITQALHYLVQSSHYCSRNLNIFIEDFKMDPEAALPHLQMFLSEKASSLATAFGIEHLTRNAKIWQAAATISESQCLVISGWEDENGVVSDVLWDQQHLFVRLMSCDNFDLEVHSILDDVQQVPTLFADSAGLDEVLRIMCTQHTQVVGLVNDEGSVQSVVKYSDIFKAFVKEIGRIYFDDGVMIEKDKSLADSLANLNGDDEDLEQEVYYSYVIEFS